MPDDVETLWVAYHADRSNVEVRNRLVEHYLPVCRRLVRDAVRKLVVLRRASYADLDAEVAPQIIAAIEAWEPGRASPETLLRVAIFRRLSQLSRDLTTRWRCRGRHAPRSIDADLRPGISYGSQLASLDGDPATAAEMAEERQIEAALEAEALSTVHRLAMLGWRTGRIALELGVPARVVTDYLRWWRRQQEPDRAAA